MKFDDAKKRVEEEQEKKARLEEEKLLKKVADDAFQSGIAGKNKSKEEIFKEWEGLEVDE